MKLRYLEQWNTQRRQHAELYDRLFVETGLAARRGEGTSDSSGGFPVRLLRTDARAQHVFHQYVIRAHRRDELREFLMARGIGTEIYYPIPLHLQACFSYLGYAKGDLPESERAAADVLAIPMFAELTEDEQRWVVENIGEFYC